MEGLAFGLLWGGDAYTVHFFWGFGHGSAKAGPLFLI
jgi:hypothetical protein